MNDSVPRAGPSRANGFGWKIVGAAALLLVAISAFAWTLYETQTVTVSSNRHTEIIAAVQRVVATATGAQSAERGYVLTGSEVFLEPYDRALTGFQKALATLTSAYSGSGLEPADLTQFTALLTAEIDFAKRVIDTRRTEGFDAAAAVVRDGEGKRLMDQVDAKAEAIDGVAHTVIAENQQRLKTASTIQTVGFAGAVAAALALAVLAYRRRKEIRGQAQVMGSLLDNASVAIGFLDSRLQVVRRNKLFTDLLMADDELALVSDPALRSQVEPILVSARAGAATANVAVEVVSSSGAARSLLLNAFPITNNGAAGLPALGLVVIDATQSAQAERKMAESEGRFRSLVGVAASIIWTAPPSGRFEQPQESWMRFTGQTESEHLGNGWLEAVHPDDRESTFKIWAAARSEQTIFKSEHRLRRADGTWRHMTVQAVPTMDPSGKIIEWVGTHTDITDLRQTEKKLGEAGAQFEALADNIPQLAWMAEPSGDIFWYNKRWFDYTGTTLEDMRGMGWRKVHHPDHQERVVEQFVRQFAEGDRWEDTFPLRGVDGSYKWFLSQATPIRDGNGKILRWFGTNTDVTRQLAVEHELAAAKDAAESANKAKSQFIANMSHELRTPLSAVIGYSEMLEEEVEDLGQDDLLADIRKIKGNARHLLSLINDVLDLSKIEADRMDIYAETFDVSTVIDEVTSTVGSLISKKENRLVIDKVGDLGNAHTDQVKLRQCLINLLSNASKFTENGLITLRVERSNDGHRDWLNFSVADTGIGMTPEQLETLFERFTQADVSTTRKFGGTGLGLAITRAFCRLLGGDIGARSEEGEGSVFTIRIPAEALEPADETEILHMPAAGEKPNAGLVLAIDDDPNARELLTRFLSREGFAVRTASDGASGLEMARAINPTVIILDVTMPKMDGWAVLTELRADPVLSNVPVVMVTIIDEHNLGYSLGASDYLLKPVEWNRLRDVMTRYRLDAQGQILAIDDDEDTLARFTALMAKENIPVVTAANGKIGLERVAERVPTLILLDLVMPVMDGFEFLDALRAKPEWKSIPVVVLSSKDLTAAEWRRLQSDADQVLSKSNVALRELVAEIHVIMQRGTVGDPPLNLANAELEPRT